MSGDQRNRPPPDDGAPFAERLGARGGRFWLSELAQTLLEPLAAVGFQPMLRSEMVQAQFWTYSVLRFDESVNWNDPQTRRQFTPFLSALAQVEEPGHAGALDDNLGVPNSILNTKHWTAVGLMGAVHLMADQPNNHAFNTSRTGRAMRKYFVTYLMALFQRLMLQRAMREASALVKSPEAVMKLTILRQSLLEFGVGGHFGQVSSRHAVQRFFAVAEDGLGLSIAWQEVRQAIDDLGAKFSAEQSLRLARETKVLAEAQKGAAIGLLHLQATVHWIEAFIVSVYAAELWNLFASGVESLHRFLPAGVVVFSIAGLVGALAILKPWKLKSAEGHNK